MMEYPCGYNDNLSTGVPDKPMTTPTDLYNAELGVHIVRTFHLNNRQ